MLAPRNKLWSSPLDVVNTAILALKITSDGMILCVMKCVLILIQDVVYDIGAGDGRFLVNQQLLIIVMRFLVDI